MLVSKYQQISPRVLDPYQIYVSSIDAEYVFDVVNSPELCYWYNLTKINEAFTSNDVYHDVAEYLFGVQVMADCLAKI